MDYSLLQELSVKEGIFAPSALDFLPFIVNTSHKAKLFLSAFKWNIGIHLAILYSLHKNVQGPFFLEEWGGLKVTERSDADL